MLSITRRLLLFMPGILALFAAALSPETGQAQGGGSQVIGGGLGGNVIPSAPPRFRAGLPPTPPPPPGFPSRPADFNRNRISPFTGASTTGTLDGTQAGQQGGAFGAQGGIGGFAGQQRGFGGGFGGLGGQGGLGGFGGGLGGLGGGNIGGFGGGGFPGGGQLGGGFFGGFGGFGGGFGGGKQFGFDGGPFSDSSFRHGVGLTGDASAMDGALSVSSVASRQPGSMIEKDDKEHIDVADVGADLRRRKLWALPIDAR